MLNLVCLKVAHRCAEVFVSRVGAIGGAEGGVQREPYRGRCRESAAVSCSCRGSYAEGGAEGAQQ
jgi:hypothetical protein